MFFERTEEFKGVHHNRPPSNQVEHLVDEVVNLNIQYDHDDNMDIMGDTNPKQIGES
jgi:hypothetical protein